MTLIEIEDADIGMLRRMACRTASVWSGETPANPRREEKSETDAPQVRTDAGRLMRDVCDSWELDGRSDCKTG